MKKCLSFLVIAALFTACQPNNELGTPFQAGQEVTLCAHMPNAGNNGAYQLPGKQRVSGKDAGTQIDLTWDAGDEIKVIVGDKSATFTLASGAGSGQATFTGTMPADGVTYSVQYPIADPDLSLQTYVKDGFGKGLMKMVANDGTIDDGFVLKAQHALLGLQLTGSDALGKIVLTNPANSKTYTLDCSGVTLTDEATLFYIVVPAGEWTDGFTVDIYADDNTTIIKTLTKNSSATFSATEAMIMPEQDVAADIYQGIGVFSVGWKTVTFSPGNLQYHPANNEWRFAPSQLDYIGNANENISPTYNGWLDLFGWGTGNNPTYSSTDYNDYQTFVDWGANQIGSDAPNTWRTLTSNGWDYLLNFRPNASSLKGVAQVNGVNGLILLPDNWTCPAGVTFKSGFHYEVGVNYYAAYQTFTAAEWSKLESAGAVFLPAAGRRIGSDVYTVQKYGYYWSATEYNSDDADYLYSRSNDASMYYTFRYYSNSVRLVKDVASYNGHEYVDLGLSVKWATCNVGATEPEEYGDYFAWGETELKDYYGSWFRYKWCNGSSTKLTKYNTKSSYGPVDNKTTLDLSDDAARANWGGSWRMPTDAELTELREQCTWTWTTQNGVYGYKVTSKKSGYTNKSIFLPAAGYRDENSLSYAGITGEYWSSSLDTGNPYYACILHFLSDHVTRGYENRYHGLPVRPVCQ